MTLSIKNWYNNFKTEIIIFIYSWLTGGIFAQWVGFDRTYDYRNYHLYNPWAFLTDRLSQDIMPACVETYFNPYLDLRHYFAYKYLNDLPYLYQFLDAIFYGFFAILVYKICKLFFENNKLLKWFSFILGITPSLAIFSISDPNNDIILADLFLLTIYLLFKYFENKSRTYFVWSAVIAGLATVFRLTNGIFVLPIGIGLFFANYDGFKASFKRSFVWMGIAFLSFLVFDGPWMFKVYSLYHNPLFPYFNSIFPSELVNPNLNILKLDFAQLCPKTFFEAVFYPFLFDSVGGTNIGFERGFSDIRMALFYSISIFGLFIILGFKCLKLSFRVELRDKYYLFFCTFFMILYPIWVYAFANARYIIPIFSLGGLMALYFIEKYMSFIFKSQKVSLYLSVFLFIFALCTTRIPGMSDFVKIPDAQYKIVHAQNIDLPDDAYVIIQCAHAFLSVFQNPKAHYVYLNNPRFTFENSYVLSDKYMKELRTLFNNKKLYIVFNMEYARGTSFKMITRGLYKMVNPVEYKTGNCRIFTSNISFHNYIVCDFVKRTEKEKRERAKEMAKYNSYNRKK